MVTGNFEKKTGDNCLRFLSCNNLQEASNNKPGTMNL